MPLGTSGGKVKKLWETAGQTDSACKYWKVTVGKTQVLATWYWRRRPGLTLTKATGSWCKLFSLKLSAWHLIFCKSVVPPARLRDIRPAQSWYQLDVTKLLFGLIRFSFYWVPWIHLTHFLSVLLGVPLDWYVPPWGGQDARLTWGVRDLWDLPLWGALRLVSVLACCSRSPFSWYPRSCLKKLGATTWLEKAS